MIDRYWKRTIPPLLVSLMAGIVAGVQYPGAGGACLAAVLAILVAVIHRLVRQRHTRVLPLCLFLGLGYLSIQPYSAPDIPTDHVARYADGSRHRIKGVIDNVPRLYDRRTKFVLGTEFIQLNGRWTGTVGRVRVTVADNSIPLRRGDKIRIEGRLRKPTNFNNPRGFDYQRYLAFQDIRVTTFVSAGRLEIVSNSADRGMESALEDFRGRIATIIERDGDDAIARVLKALVIGQRSEISREVRDRFSRAGVSHLLAISGLHVGIVATLCFFVFRWFLSHWELLLRHALVRRLAAVAAIFPVVFYGVVTGMSPSTQRAVIMAGVFLIGVLIQREQDLINTLSTAALIILAVHPPALYSISFQLSFTAVLGMVHVLPKIQPGLPSGPVWIRKPLAFMVVSLVAIMSTLPLTMFYFNQASVMGVVANLVAVPMIGFIVVPLGLVVLLLAHPLPTLEGWVVAAARGILGWCMGIINYLAQSPFAAFKTVTPSLFEIACYYLLGWALFNMRGQKSLDTGGALHRGGSVSFFRRPFPGSMARIVLVVVGVALAADVSFWVYERFLRRDLRVTFIDVGQGSATLVEAPYGRVFLVDGGGFGDNRTFDVGERIVAPLLWRKKIATVDILVLTHPNSDHLNGLLYIARHFDVSEVWANNDLAFISTYAEFQSIMASRDISKPDFEDLERDRIEDGLQMEILHPAPGYRPIINQDAADGLNDNSLVLKLTFGNVSLLLPGDIELSGERQLIASGRRRLKSTILLAPHHGSKTSSSRVFLECVSPRLIVVACGRPGRSRFPHPQVMERYTRMGIAVLTTFQNGAITVVTDGQGMMVNTFR